MARLISFDPRERQTPLQSGVQAPTQVQSGAPSVGLDASALGREATKVGQSLANAELKAAKAIRDRHMKLEKIRMESDFFDYSKQVARQIESGEISSEDAITSTFGEFTSSALESSPFSDEMEPDIRLISERYRQSSIQELLSAQERANTRRMLDNWKVIKKHVKDQVYDRDMSTAENFSQNISEVTEELHAAALTSQSESIVEDSVTETMRIVNDAFNIYLDRGAGEYLTVDGYQKALKVINDQIRPNSKEMAYTMEKRLEEVRNRGLKQYGQVFTQIYTSAMKGNLISDDEAEMLIQTGSVLYPDSNWEQLAHVANSIISANQYFDERYAWSLGETEHALGDKFDEYNGRQVALSQTLAHLEDEMVSLYKSLPSADEIAIITAEGPTHPKFAETMAGQMKLSRLGKLAEGLRDYRPENAGALADIMYNGKFTQLQNDAHSSMLEYMAASRDPSPEGQLRADVAHQKAQSALMESIEMAEEIDNAVYVLGMGRETIDQFNESGNMQGFAQAANMRIAEKQNGLYSGPLNVLPEATVKLLSDSIKSSNPEDVSRGLRMFADMFAKPDSPFAQNRSVGEAWFELVARGELTGYESSYYLMNYEKVEFSRFLEQLNLPSGMLEKEVTNTNFAYQYLMSDPDSAFSSIFGTILGDTNYNDQKIFARAISRALEQELGRTIDPDEKKQILDNFVRALTKDKVYLAEIKQGPRKGQKIAMPAGNMNFMLTGEGERYLSSGYDGEGYVGDSEAQAVYDQATLAAYAKLAMATEANTGTGFRNLLRFVSPVSNIWYHPWTDDNFDTGVLDYTRSPLSIGSPGEGPYPGFEQWDGLPRRDLLNHLSQNMYLSPHPDGDKFQVTVLNNYGTPVPIYFGQQPIIVETSSLSHLKKDWTGTVAYEKEIRGGLDGLLNPGVGKVIVERSKSTFQELLQPFAYGVAPVVRMVGDMPSGEERSRAYSDYLRENSGSTDAEIEAIYQVMGNKSAVNNLRFRAQQTTPKKK